MSRLLQRAISGYADHDCVSQAAAMAFYALFALLPVPIFVISGAAALIGADLARAEVLEVIQELAGEQMAVTLREAFDSAGELTSWREARLYGLASVVFGATAFFVQLQETLNRIWGLPPGSFRWRSFLRSRLVSFAMVAAAGGVLLALTLSATLVRALGDRIEVTVPRLAFLYGLGSGLLAFGAIVLVFALVFRHVPDHEIAWRDVWLGALATAVLFVGGNELLGLYLRNARLATAYGTAGSLVLTLMWVYYSALAFLFGAELTRALAHRRERR